MTEKLHYDDPFTQQVIEVLENARRDNGMSVNALCAASGIGRNSYFTKIRGERAFTTQDISKIAEALGLDTFLVLRKAAKRSHLRAVPNVSTQMDDDFEEATAEEVEAALARRSAAQVRDGIEDEQEHDNHP